MCCCIVCLHQSAWLRVVELDENFCIDTAVFALINRVPSSASAADDVTARIICEMLRTAQLLMGILFFPAMIMGLDMYNASLWIARTMLLVR